MKKIAITQRLIENTPYYEKREALDTNYTKLLKECGFLPIILPYEIDFQEYFKNIKIEGILLTGGNDLYSCNKNELSKQRDLFEKELIKYAITFNIPIFGICRGMQIIADYFKSSFKEVKNQINIKHKLLINKNSKYNLYLNRLKEVNSFHNFAIEKISEELIICATNEEGIIKAIEHKKYKIFAQMWHTERKNPFSKEEIALIKAFYD